MTTVYVNVTLGAKRVSGSRNVTVSRGTAVSGDVTVAINTSTVMSRGDIIAAASAAADHLMSDTVK